MTPYIISASRREDIPSFKVDWLLERIQEGKVIGVESKDYFLKK